MRARNASEDISVSPLAEADTAGWKLHDIWVISKILLWFYTGIIFLHFWTWSYKSAVVKGREEEICRRNELYI